MQPILTTGLLQQFPNMAQQMHPDLLAGPALISKAAEVGLASVWHQEASVGEDTTQFIWLVLSKHVDEGGVR